MCFFHDIGLIKTKTVWHAPDLSIGTFKPCVKCKIPLFFFFLLVTFCRTIFQGVNLLAKICKHKNREASFCFLSQAPQSLATSLGVTPYPQFLAFIIPFCMLPLLTSITTRPSLCTTCNCLPVPSHISIIKLLLVQQTWHKGQKYFFLKHTNMLLIFCKLQ